MQTEIQPSIRSHKLLDMRATNADYERILGPVKLLPIYEEIPARCPKCGEKLILKYAGDIEPLCYKCGEVFCRPLPVVPERPKHVPKPKPEPVDPRVDHREGPKIM